MAGGDWIKLHRKMLDSPIMRHDGMFRLWAYCLLYANWKPAKWLMPGTLREIQVGRGQFVTGRLSLHRTLYPQRDLDGRPIEREWTPCPRTLWRWLDALRIMGCVKLETLSNRCTIVTVCNYALYQEVADVPCPADVPLMSRSCPADVPLMSTTEEGKKERREEGKNSFSPPTLDEVAVYCRDRNNSVDAEAFVSHYQSQGWRVGKVPMKDWKAAVRTWERNEGKFNGKSKGKEVDLFRGAREFLEGGPMQGGLS